MSEFPRHNSYIRNFVSHNYKNQLAHARQHSLKSAALGVGHHAVVSPFVD
jgi:hypothetical protein